MRTLHLLLIYVIYAFLVLGAVGLETVGQRLLKQRWRWGLYGGLAVVAIGFMWLVSEPPHRLLFSDFNKAYYPAGRLILQDPSNLYNWVDYVGTQGRGFVNIPILAYLFVPFSLLSQFNADLLLLALSLVGVIAAYFLLLKFTRISGWKRTVLAALFLLNGPLYHSIKEGNTTHFVLLLLIAAVFWIRSKREIWLGAILAFAALIKIPLFLLGFYYVARGRWRVVAGLGAALLAIVGASVLLFGVDLHVTWFQQCIQDSAGKPIAAYNVQSVDGFLIRLLTDSALNNWWPVPVNWDFKLARYVSLALLMGSVIWVCWRSKAPTTPEAENLEFSAVLCLSLLISPISWTHYYLFLLLPLALYLGGKLAVPVGRSWFGLVALGAFLVSPPVIAGMGYFKPDHPILKFLIFKVFISHWFFGATLLLGVLLAARWFVARRSPLLRENIDVLV